MDGGKEGSIVKSKKSKTINADYSAQQNKITLKISELQFAVLSWSSDTL